MLRGKNRTGCSESVMVWIWLTDSRSRRAPVCRSSPFPSSSYESGHVNREVNDTLLFARLRSSVTQDHLDHLIFIVQLRCQGMSSIMEQAKRVAASQARISSSSRLFNAFLVTASNLSKPLAVDGCSGRQLRRSRQIKPLGHAKVTSTRPRGYVVILAASCFLFFLRPCCCL